MGKYLACLLLNTQKQPKKIDVLWVKPCLELPILTLYEMNPSDITMMGVLKGILNIRLPVYAKTFLPYAISPVQMVAPSVVSVTCGCRGRAEHQRGCRQ